MLLKWETQSTERVPILDFYSPKWNFLQAEWLSLVPENVAIVCALTFIEKISQSAEHAKRKLIYYLPWSIQQRVETISSNYA